MPYDLQTIRAPRLYGVALRAAAELFDNPATRVLLAPKLLADAGVDRFRRAVLTEAPAVAPRLPRPATLEAHAREAMDLRALGERAPAPRGARVETAAEFVRAYREGRTTPLAVAERALEAMRSADALSPPLRAVIARDEHELLAQARASTERWQRGAPLGPLDGVPVAIKDELDVRGLPTTVGTRFLDRVASEDATVVARLRAAGALLIGKTNMHEIGIDPSGFNPHHGTARNPYDPTRNTGGSSSGSGAAVAAGLCPIAIGADGGGSIRIPASLCGVVGLKATWSRVSEHGAAPLCWSVAHVGPLAASARDAALAYAIIAGPDERDPSSLNQPPPHLDGLGNTNVEGLRLGVYTPWFEHAEPDVVSCCRALLRELENRGAKIVEVEIPDLELGRLAHAITILSEMATAMEPYDAAHRGKYGHGVRISLTLARELTNRDYVRAQQVRTRLTAHLERVLASVDAVVTPATAITAPPIGPQMLPYGETNLDVTSALMRFAFPTNLTGHPSISVPAGYDRAGLPVGLQFIGRAWEEHLLLRLAEVTEELVERRAPRVHYRLLPA
jgi:Asp-tRNA(Asn)/Glu-tRNA(Gln) amidotransferase A subunit family amidase